MNRAKREAIFARLQQQNPEPTTELNYGSPFELLVAVILSAQATDISVNKATDTLFKTARTPSAILALGPDGLTRHVKSIGLYNSKVKNILATCKILLEKFGGKVPQDRVQLESLPGVGRKTANVVMNTAFGAATIAVDTHIFRVANRTKIAPGKTPREVEDRLVRLVPDPYKKNAHHWLILHGRYVCKARKPLCSDCLISDLCEYGKKSI